MKDSLCSFIYLFINRMFVYKMSENKILNTKKICLFAFIAFRRCTDNRCKGVAIWSIAHKLPKNRSKRRKIEICNSSGKRVLQVFCAIPCNGSYCSTLYTHHEIDGFSRNLNHQKENISYDQ
jgi:hypothetical protein